MSIIIEYIESMLQLLNKLVIVFFSPSRQLSEDFGGKLLCRRWSVLIRYVVRQFLMCMVKKLLVEDAVDCRFVER